MPQREPGGRRGGGQQAGLQVDPAGDPANALRTVPGGVEAGDDSQQHLGGADVAGGLLAADVLLAGLQGEAQRRVPGRILADADQPARHQPLERVAGGEEPGMRAAEAHRHAEPLGGADHHVGAHLARRRQQRERQQVGTDDRQRVHVVRGGDLGVQIAHGTGGAGVLQHDREGVGGADRGQVAGLDIHQREAERRRPGRQHGTGLRVQVGRDHDGVGFRLARGMRHRHRLGRCGRLVQQGRVGDRHRGEVAHHGLEVEQRFQPPLRDLGLVGGVGGVPARVLQHVAQDHRWRVGAVIALADQVLRGPVLRRQAAQLGDNRRLVDGGRQRQRRLAPDRRRDGAGNQLVQRCGADHVQHGGEIVGRRGHVAADEAVGGLEVGEFGERVEAGVHHSVSTSSS